MEALKKDWKFSLGITLFCYSWLPYLVAVILLFFSISLTNALIILGVFITSAEIAFALSIILLGKPFLQFLKTKIKQYLFRSEALPLQPISKTKHYIGITLLLLTFIPYFFVEIGLLCGYPKTHAGHIEYFLILLSSDIAFVIGLCILGGDFWDRLQNLFKWQDGAIK